VASYKRLLGGVVFLEVRTDAVQCSGALSPVQALPRSLAGKLLRKELRKL
jgi:hypothetical protein